VHRDLKGANVVLGRFGEVVVLDWGLARVLGAGDPDVNERPVEPLPDIELERSQEGWVKGTPTCMAPEQARGEVSRIDRRTDVFGLGGILYEILTGQPPYQGTSRNEVLDRARRGEVRSPRTLAGWVPRPLEAVCLKALAARPEDRYATATELAEEVKHWLAGEPVRAWPEPWPVRAGRWVRQHRVTATATAAALVVALVLLTGGGVMWRLAKLERRRRGADHAETNLVQVSRLRQQMHWKEAWVLMDQAERAVEEAEDEGLRARFVQAKADLELAEELDRIREAAHALDDGKWAPGRARGRYPEVFLEYGLDMLQDSVEALAARIAASAVRGEILAALDDWTLSATQTRRRRLLVLTSRIDPENPWRKLLLEGEDLDDRVRRGALLAQVKHESLAPATAVFLFALLGQGTPEGLKLLAWVRERRPDDFWLNFTLGNELAGDMGNSHEDRDRSRQEEAIGYLRAALAVKPNSSVALNNLGFVLSAKGEVGWAIRKYREALRLDPKLAMAHNNLGVALSRQGDVEGAIRSYREALLADPNEAKAHTNLGLALAAKGDLEGAIRCHSEAIRLNPNYALAHNNLGAALHSKKDMEGAIRCHREAIRLNPRLAMIHHNLGLVLYDKGDMEEAIRSYREALRLDPRLAQTQNNLGNALRGRGDLEGAIRSYQEAIRLASKDAATHSNLGVALHDKGDVEGAIRTYREAIRLDPKLAQTHNNLGNALCARGDVEGAIRSYQEAIRLAPRNASTHRNLGLALYARGDVEGAIHSYRQAIRLVPRFADAHTDLGVALQDKGEVEGAIRSHAEAIRLNPQLARAHRGRGNALHARGDLEGAIRSHREAIRLDPTDALALGALGDTLMSFGDFASARRSFQQAAQLLPPANRLSPVVADRLARCRALLEQEQRLHAVLAGKSTPKNAAELTALARLATLPAKQLYGSAARLYIKALQAEPALAGDLRSGHRYNTACACARAGTGQGKDVSHLDATQRAQMRYRALCWLQEDLASHTRQLARSWTISGKPSYRALRHWRQGADLAGVRDPALLGKLPEAEQVAWRNLWAQVDALLARFASRK
jgi:tetratricopeptide (TPR) repeat protein